VFWDDVRSNDLYIVQSHKTAGNRGLSKIATSFRSLYNSEPFPHRIILRDPHHSQVGGAEQLDLVERAARWLDGIDLLGFVRTMKEAEKWAYAMLFFTKLAQEGLVLPFFIPDTHGGVAVARQQRPAAPPPQAQPTVASSAATECCVCLTNEIDSVLLDCGHSVLCLECATNIKACPICRANVVRAIKVFKG
jgi:hypothetical protein